MSWLLPWNWYGKPNAPETEPIVHMDDEERPALEDLANSLIINKTKEEIEALNPDEFAIKVKNTWSSLTPEQKEKWREGAKKLEECNDSKTEVKKPQILHFYKIADPYSDNTVIGFTIGSEFAHLVTKDLILSTLHNLNCE